MVSSGVSLRYSRSLVIEILGASEYEFAIGNRVGRLQHVPDFGTGPVTEATYLGGTSWNGLAGKHL